MSQRVETHVACDGPGCEAAVSVPSYGDEARANLRAVGWRRSRVLAGGWADLCPACLLAEVTAQERAAAEARIAARARQASERLAWAGQVRGGAR